MEPSSLFLIREIYREALEAGASDVHLAVGLPPRMRVDGALLTMGGSKITPADIIDILINTLPETQREIFERRGEYTYSFSVSDGGRCRVSAYRQRGNIAMALRLIGSEIPSLETLGIPGTVAGLCQRQQGLVLVGGACGSGRTTTLAALIDEVNESRESVIVTLESPIEFLHSHKKSIVNQREIGVDSESYAEALRATLREDPDVILVGELCDAGTVEAALTAAETGHLVFAGVCATCAVNAVERLIGMFPPHSQESVRARLADVLEASVFQKLIPAVDGSGRMAAYEVSMGRQRDS